ncbi:Hypothetical Protein FCC1311_111352 [Hondaea fermentalgiana]|uniref:F-box domain-containing protein n=1 Tax=Hondaea fermentalgiana TaxID=2315210 RepID=A0A2R5GVN3_9STRA|nr:Hypothetical Protein FCC1311_111352 [Hondaea fermentalgiana]|eukprot:GBG34912.1 Hypothetical Protein FCC1311_111352 [Hondaea fermentalgiana]
MLDHLMPCILNEMLEFLGEEDLVRLGMCCTRMYIDVIREEPLWARRCAELWRNKVSIPPTLLTRPDIRSFFWSRLAAKDVSAVHLEHILTSTCFHMRFAQGTAQLYGFEDETGRPVPMFRKFAPGGRYLRYPEAHDRASNCWALSPVKDPVEHHEEMYGPLLPGHTLKWSFSADGKSVALANLPPLRVSRREDNWAWRLENEFLVYETCSAETVNDPHRLDVSFTAIQGENAAAVVDLVDDDDIQVVGADAQVSKSSSSRKRTRGSGDRADRLRSSRSATTQGLDAEAIADETDSGPYNDYDDDDDDDDDEDWRGDDDFIVPDDDGGEQARLARAVMESMRDAMPRGFAFDPLQQTRHGGHDMPMSPSEAFEADMKKAIAQSKSDEAAKIREEQNREFEQSLAADRAKEEAKRREMQEKNRVELEREKAKQARQKARDERIALLESWKTSLPPEPASSAPQAIHLALLVPAGRFKRSFDEDATLFDLMRWVAITDPRCHFAPSFEIVVPPNRRLSSNMAADEMKTQTLKALGLRRDGIRPGTHDDEVEEIL